MNKTVYLRPEDVEVWDHARQLSGNQLSPIIVAALKRYIAGREEAISKMSESELRKELMFNYNKRKGMKKC